LRRRDRLWVVPRRDRRPHRRALPQRSRGKLSATVGPSWCNLAGCAGWLISRVARGRPVAPPRRRPTP
jgi:hypothetical protein